ncbi:hypothetical protein BH09DEP1_BH09DEP1_1070 [soil metagenome]
MGAARATLLIWLAIMHHACLQGMNPAALASPDKSTDSPNQLLTLFPKLYSEAGVKQELKKAYREGYSKGMEEGHLVVSFLEKQVQEEVDHFKSEQQIRKQQGQELAKIKNRNLALEKKIIEAQIELAGILKIASKQTPHIPQLQNVFLLLSKDDESPQEP